MADASTTSADRDPLWQKRWLLLASLISALFGTAVLVSVHHAGWSWLLFGWGCAVGVGALAIVALIGFVLGREAVTEDQRLLLRHRLIIYTFCWIVGGLICGSVSAAFQQPWIDIVVTGYVVLILGAAGLLVLRRRSANGSR